MVMKIEIMETFGDYSAVVSPSDAPIDVHWIVGTGTAGVSLANATLDASDRALKFVNNAGFFSSILTRMFAVPVAKVTASIGFAVITLDVFPAMFILIDASGNTQMSMRMNNVGKLIISGEGGVTLATSQSNFVTGTIYRICWRAEMLADNSVHVQCSVNGFDDPGLDVTADFQDATATTLGGFRVQGFNNGDGSVAAKQWELLHLMVGTGECVDWGPLEIADVAPNIDIVSDWIPSTGTDNFAMVDESPANADTDYNRSETPGAQDIYGFSDGEIPDKIIAIGLCSWARKEDSATRKFKQLLRVSGVNYYGPDIFCAETYGRFIDAWTQNPNTAADWDPADLAPIEAGYEYIGA